MTTSLYEVRPARLADCRYIARHLRGSDAREVQASHGLDPRDALELSFHNSELSYVCTYKFNPLFVFGRTKIIDNAACVWLLGATQMRQHVREFLRITVSYFHTLHVDCPLLYNYVDERNEESIRWLKWAGAKFIARHPTFGHESKPFLEFIHYEEQPCVPLS